MATRAGGRELPGRLSFGALRLDGVALPALAAVAAIALTRIPLRTRYLLNWDADQFALGLKHLDVVHHEPHPPGYIGYILLGRLLETVGGDANAALQNLSIAGEAVAAALGFAFARRLFGAPAAWITVLAIVTSPLLWYYGEAANTYALEPALALAIAWLAWPAWNHRPATLVPLGVTFALAGAVRPSTAVFLAPMAVVAVIRAGDPLRAIGAAVAAVAGTLAWLLPLLALTGGPWAYVRASTELGSDVSAGTAIWQAGLAGLGTTSAAVLRGITWEFGGFAVVAVFGFLVAPRLGARLQLPPGWASFCMTWTLPALLTFLFVHIGQVAYVQVFTPALFLTLGPALVATAGALGRQGLVRAIAALCALTNVAVFALPPGTSLAGQLRRHDAGVEDMARAVRAFPAERTVIVADAFAVGSYRTAQVYLPEYHRIGVARDGSGRPGAIYGDVYRPEGFRASAPLLPAPGTDTYLFVDRSTVEQLVADPERMRVVALAGGQRIYVWVGAPPRARDGYLWLEPPPEHPRGLRP